MAFSVDPYLDRAYDARRYHCWTLVCEAWRDLTGQDLARARVRQALVETAQPVSPCVVTMRHATGPTHAGLFRNGRLLHIRPEGVAYERLDNAVRGFREVRFYADCDAHSGPARPA